MGLQVSRLDRDKSPSERELFDGSQNLNPSGISLCTLIAEDWRTHGRAAPGFFAIALHRYGNWRMSVRTKILRSPLTLLYRMLFPLVTIVTGIKLSYNVKLGRRVRIEHFGGMILGARQIGDDCVIRQGTTFGIRSTSSLCGKPTIESRVDIGCGVVILGDILIGHDSVIGANAVVLKDVPPYSVVAGVPARVVKLLTPREGFEGGNA